jgi:hypothetical protein
MFYLINTNRPVIMGLKINIKMCRRQGHVYRDCMLHVSGDKRTNVCIYIVCMRI